MVDGKSACLQGKTLVQYEWYGSCWTVDTYIMDDARLTFPILLGLDFNMKTAAVLEMGKKPQYRLPSGQGNQYY